MHASARLGQQMAVAMSAAVDIVQRVLLCLPFGACRVLLFAYRSSWAICVAPAAVIPVHRAGRAARCDGNAACSADFRRRCLCVVLTLSG